MADSVAFEDFNPIMQAEIISFYDWQWNRVRKAHPVSRDKFILTCMKVATELHRCQCAYIFACCMSGCSDLDQMPHEDASYIIRTLYRAYLLPEDARAMLDRVDSLTRSGRSALQICTLPMSCILAVHFHPAPVFLRYSHYRKASNRVYLFLKSLGTPDKGLRREFLTDICNIQEAEAEGKRMVSCSPYEQHLMLDASEGGKTSTVFLDLYVGAGAGILLVRSKDNVDGKAGLYIVSTRRELVGEEYSQDDELFKNPDGEKYADYFDLLVNAWVAEKTGMVVSGEENRAEKARVRNIIGSVYKVKDTSVRYEYIKVTDKAWQMHTESQRAFHERSEDCTYTKYFWWRRPHFAIRGVNKVMVKGHWCHRRCGDVVEVNEPQVIEVLT